MFKITSMGPDKVDNSEEKKRESEKRSVGVTTARVEEKERARILHLHPVLME